MKATPKTDLKQRIRTLANRFLALEADADDTEGRRKHLQPYIDGLERGIFKLVVVGEVKKGKSSFINALLAVGELLPTDIDVATSVVYKILYGPTEKFTVFFQPSDEDSNSCSPPLPIAKEQLVHFGTESGRGGATNGVGFKLVYGSAEKFIVHFFPAVSAPPKEITRNQLGDYATHVGNPGNQKSVDFIEACFPTPVAFIAVELPSPLLREGIVIIDTPGVGGLFKRHRDITFSHTPEANAVFFVVDSVEAPIGGSESDCDGETKFLNELKKSTDQIFFVQTKTDAVDPEQREGYRQRNLEILTKLLGRPAAQIPYFLVSSTLKSSADQQKDGQSLNDSGFLAVIQFLRDVLLPRRNVILAKQLAQALTAEVVAEGHSVQEQLSIAQETNKPKLAEYRTQLDEAERQYEDWISEKWPKQLRTFQEYFSRIRQKASNEIQDCLSPDSPCFVNSFERACSTCKKPEHVAELGPDFLADYAAECNQEVKQILEEFVTRVRKAYEDVLTVGASELSKIRVPQLQFEASQVRTPNSGRFDAFRAAAMNWNLVGNLASKTAGAVGWTAAAATWFGLLSNPVGWTVAATAGLTAIAARIWTSVRGYKTVRQNQVAAALANLERAMQTTSQRAQRISSRVLQELASDLESKTRDGFDEFKASTKAQFTKRKKDLRDAELRTAAEVKQAVAALNARLQTLVDLAQALKNINQQAPEKEEGY